MTTYQYVLMPKNEFFLNVEGHAYIIMTDSDALIWHTNLYAHT